MVCYLFQNSQPSPSYVPQWICLYDYIPCLPELLRKYGQENFHRTAMAQDAGLKSYPRQSCYSILLIQNLHSQAYLIQCRWFSSVPACLPAYSRHLLQVLAENKRAGEMVQQVKALASKSDEWSFISRTQMMEGETQLPNVILSPPQESFAAHKHTNNQMY